MSITKILTDNETSAEQKLKAVAEIVATARENYGNADMEIEVPRANTAHGSMLFTHLEDEAKVELLRYEASRIKAAAFTYVEEHPGSVLKKRVEELVATNGMFANIDSSIEFDYL